MTAAAHPSRKERRFWTEEEIEAALSCTKRGDVARLAKSIDRTAGSVTTIRYRHGAKRLRTDGALRIGGYTKRMRRIWAAENERTRQNNAR